MLKILVLLYVLMLLFLGIHFCIKVRRDIINESKKNRGKIYTLYGRRYYIN